MDITQALPDFLLQQGLAASETGDYETALDFFRQSAAANSQWGWPHFLMASEQAAAGNFEAAEAAFAAAVVRTPDFHIARYQLGTLQFTSGRSAMALVTWQPLFELSDDEPLRLFVMGYAALAAGEFQRAAENFRSGISLNSANPALNRDIQLVLERVAQAADDQAVVAEFPESEDSGEGHVLFSNYRHQGGPTH